MARRLPASIRGVGGFTLIEMIVALLVVGAIMGISVVGINAITSAKLREEAGRLAAVIRATYALAVTNGRAHRIVFDLDGGTYSVEWTDDPVLLSQERERAHEGARVEEPEEPRGGSLLGTAGQAPRLPKPGWRKVPKEEMGLLDNEKQEVALSKDIEFEGIFTTHQLDLYTRGKAELYFFPQGWAEAAVIYLREKGEQGEVFSVEVDPLTGRATIHNEKIAIPPEWREERGKEEEGEKIF